MPTPHERTMRTPAPLDHRTPAPFDSRMDSAGPVAYAVRRTEVFRPVASVRTRNDEQALDLPGEEPRRLPASYTHLVLVWAASLVVAVGYIGMPLTMFLIPMLGSTSSAIAVALSLVIAGVLGVRFILRAILTERRRRLDAAGRHRAPQQVQQFQQAQR